MGTGQPGRYLNTAGSARSISEFALVHSNEGTFTRTQIKVDGKSRIKLRLRSGGHGQKGMDLLDRYKIEYHIVKTYQNGVRIGYIPNHVQKNKRTGTGQSWFPESWTEKDIRRAGEHVASLKSNRHVKDGKAMYGYYKGVRVGVIRTYGKNATVFPDSNQKKRR